MTRVTTGKHKVRDQLKLSIVEELWFGDFPDDEAEQAAAESMVSLTSKVLGLRPFPAQAEKIVRLARDPTCIMSLLVRQIEGDPAFAARTLRLVNSAAMATRMPCKSIHQAVMRAGTSTIGEMAIAAAVIDMFDDDDELPGRLREHSLVVAAISRHIALKLGLPGDDVYTCGLMHDIGQLLLLQYAPDDGYADLLLENHEVDTVHIAERERYAFDHGVLGAHVLRGWNIPEPVPWVVACHHHFSKAQVENPELARFVAVIRVADFFANRRAEDISEVISQISEMPEAEYLELTKKQLARWWIDLQIIADESIEAEEGDSENTEKHEVLCAECGEPGRVCEECFTTFCGQHGDNQSHRCNACKATRKKNKTNENVEQGAAVHSAPSSDISNFTLGVSIVGGVLILAAISFALIVWG